MQLVCSHHIDGIAIAVPLGNQYANQGEPYVTTFVTSIVRYACGLATKDTDCSIHFAQEHLYFYSVACYVLYFQLSELFRPSDLPTVLSSYHHPQAHMLFGLAFFLYVLS